MTWNPIRATDEVLQDAFGRVFVALMRRGVPRSRIRWTLWVGYTMGYVLSLYTFFLDPFLAPLAVLFLGLHVWLYGNRMTLERAEDERAEQRGMPSYVDNHLGRKGNKLIGAVFLALSIGTPVGLFSGVLVKYWPNDVGRFVAGVFALAVGYLGGVPPTKPQKKTLQVPADARSTLA